MILLPIVSLYYAPHFFNYKFLLTEPAITARERHRERERQPETEREDRAGQGRAGRGRAGQGRAGWCTYTAHLRRDCSVSQRIYPPMKTLLLIAG